LTALAAAPGSLTARQVIERIQKQVGVPWSADTVDTFKAGNPDTPVTGIATTFMATMDVLERAAASGKNLIISHEPTFYNHLDKIPAPGSDAVVDAKRAFIEKHHLVVWRFHDHWHARVPDGINEAMPAALGWKLTSGSGRLPLFTLPETTLERVAADLRTRLSLHALRVVGDPKMKITRAALVAGAAGSEAHIKTLERSDVDLLVVGEVPEWETIPYVRDAVSQGRHKALILLGHVPSEEPGMENCARWLRTFVSEVPVEFIPAGEPFWEPK
jgi:putative NIF3 family GTP cyclohydrolase 1 type 2